jgi:hypothetical protein
MDHLSRAFAPLTWLVDIIPALVYLPDGFPGTFKATARQWKATNEAAMEIPYWFVTVRPGADVKKALPAFICLQPLGAEHR